MVISSDMTYGLEMVVPTKRQEAELKMFRVRSEQDGQDYK